MQTLISFTSVLAVASAGLIHTVPVFYVAEPLPTYNQAQNTLTGEYAYSYAGGPSAKEEIKTLDGVTRGAYSYIDAHGVVQSAQYVADDAGFRILATDIPTDAQIGVNVPIETPEVQAAKAAHFAEHAKAIAALGRKKRSLVHAEVPTTVTTEYHDQKHDESVHIAAPVYHQQYSALPVAYAHAPVAVSALPTAVSHQSRHQVHNNAKIEVSVPVYAHAVETVPAIAYQDTVAVAAPLKAIHAAPVAAVASVPTAVSSQSRFQVHKNEKIEIHQPIYDTVISPVAHPVFPVVAHPTLPVFAHPAPVVSVVRPPSIISGFSPAPAEAPVATADGDSVIVDALRTASPAASAAAAVSSVPSAVSSQSKTEIHSNERVEINTPQYHHVPQVYAAQVVNSYGYPTTVLKAAAPAPLAVATSVSSQSRSEHHSSKRVEVSGAPVYGTAARLAHYPQIVQDTPEVAAAKQAHAEAYAAELVKHQGW